MSHERACEPPLRILQVVLSRGFAGTERAVAETCNALCERHAVALAVRRDHRAANGASIRDYVDPRVEVVELPPLWLTKAALGRVIARWRPDVIHTHLRRGTRYVVQLGTGTAHVASLHIGLNGDCFLATDGLLCITEWQVEAVRRAGYRGHVSRIPNSLVRHPRLPAPRLAELRRDARVDERTFVVGAVGRLTTGKGFDVLIEAFRRAALPGARLVVVGDGSARRSLERAARGAPVTFCGFRADAKDWYQVFDVFVCPSRVEPFGRVIIEALDAGAPVIASAAQGPTDIAARYPIELFPVGDAVALAAALERAVRRPRTRLAVDLSEFDVERVAQSLLSLYRATLGSEVRSEPARLQH